MTPNLTALLTRLKDLEKKRTPGEWSYAKIDKSIWSGERLKNEKHHLEMAKGSKCVLEPNWPEDTRLSDVKFITTLANTNSRLLQILETAVGVLEDSCKCEYGQKISEHDGLPRLHVDVICAACEALQKIERLAEKTTLK